MEISQLFDFERLRNNDAHPDKISMSDLEEILSTSGQNRSALTAFAYSSIQMRRALSMLPKIPEHFGFNLRLRLVENYLNEQGLKIDKDYRQSDLEHIVEICNRISDFIRGNQKKSWSDLHVKTRQELLRECNFRCSVCGFPLDVSGTSSSKRRPELDHKVPFIFGGNQNSNLRIICKTCNSAKGVDIAVSNVATISQNMFYRKVSWKKISYWAFERDQSKCRIEGCSNTAHTHRLLLLKRRRDGHDVLDNLETVCESCFSKAPKSLHPEFSSLAQN